MLKVRDVPLEWYLDAFRKYKNFTFVRWGDSECRAMMREEIGRTNSDGVTLLNAIQDVYLCEDVTVA